MIHRSCNENNIITEIWEITERYSHCCSVVTVHLTSYRNPPRCTFPARQAAPAAAAGSRARKLRTAAAMCRRCASAMVGIVDHTKSFPFCPFLHYTAELVNVALDYTTENYILSFFSLRYATSKRRPHQRALVAPIVRLVRVRRRVHVRAQPRAEQLLQFIDW